MQSTGERTQRSGAGALSASRSASFAIAVVLACTFGTAHAASGPTAWTDSVRSSLAANGMAGSATAAPAPLRLAAVQPAGSRPVTLWARSVEARLAAHAHRVAEAGRSALAWSESGMASWYGGDHTGHRTSSGDVFNPMRLTCAHPTLPLGTKVLVTSDTTGRSVVVTVNDRGPFGRRIVDLSREAASRIGMLASGTASVTLQQATPEAIEVAQADDADTSDQAIAAAGDEVSPRPRGLPHTLRADR